MDVQNKLISFLKYLTKNNCKCYYIEDRTYGYIITPINDIIYIQFNSIEPPYISLVYKPNKKFGTNYGLPHKNLLEECYSDINNFYKYIFECKRLIVNYDINFYKNEEDWLNQYWQKHKLIEVKGEM